MAQNRYVKDIAQALVEQSKAVGVVAQVVADIINTCSALLEDKATLSTLKEVSIPLDGRREALREGLKGAIHEYAMNSFLLLQQHGALGELESFRSTVVELAEKSADHREVSVISAVELDDKQLEKLAKTLKEKFGGTQRLHTKIDQSVLGGVKVKIGDWSFDGTLKTKIIRLKQALYV